MSICIEECCDCKIKQWAKSSFCWESLQSRPNSQCVLSHCSPGAPSLGRYPGSCILCKSINNPAASSLWRYPGSWILCKSINSPAASILRWYPGSCILCKLINSQAASSLWWYPGSYILCKSINSPVAPSLGRSPRILHFVLINQ